MKKIIFIIGVVLQFSSTCFSQDSSAHYTDSEIIKLVNHIKQLEKQNSSVSRSLAFNRIITVAYNRTENNEQEKSVNKNKGSQCYTSDEVIKLANYIRYLEKINLQNTTGDDEAIGESVKEFILKEQE